MSSYSEYASITPSAWSGIPSSTATLTTSVSSPDVLDELLPYLPDGNKYLSADDFIYRHAQQMHPPKNGWVHGSRVMCAMRQKSTNEYFPRVQCYVHREGNEVFLIQKCCKGSPPTRWPKQFDQKMYKSWTLRSGEATFLESEQVAYLGCCEGRNAL